ncbi:hypothetical protein RhiirA4_491710 [Rhizophagus irregularis]|uniref:Uncharacterized protein n=1 Tax=Rhizophagus irregularis TaxID=588596 RepID=A0A2I1HWM0_9GLOM|nr:hypothetical protein RhiirA4_491710 [Rhizophagus irregularis]
MSWAYYRFIAELSVKERIAKWFQLLTRWIKGISAPEMPRHSLFSLLSNILQPIKKNGEKIECLIIEVCNIEICSNNSQKAIIQKQECPKMITITHHNALVLPIFIHLSTGAITHIDWYYIVESLNRTKNISANIDI